MVVPGGFDMVISGQDASTRNFVERAAVGARAPAGDGNCADQHASSNENKHASGAVVAQKPGNGKTADDYAETAPGIDEADGARADARRVKLGLISVIREGKP